MRKKIVLLSIICIICFSAVSAYLTIESSNWVSAKYVTETKGLGYISADGSKNYEPGSSLVPSKISEGECYYYKVGTDIHKLVSAGPSEYSTTKEVVLNDISNTITVLYVSSVVFGILALISFVGLIAGIVMKAPYEKKKEEERAKVVVQVPQYAFSSTQQHYTPVQPQSAMQICPYCGVELRFPEPPKFCPYCRKQLE